jgi:site-specific recombinase XerD
VPGCASSKFFASAIRNPHTRRAYARAVGEFLAWCADAGVPSLAAVQQLHVAAWIERQTATLAAPTVKQRLAAIRHLFDWLMSGDGDTGFYVTGLESLADDDHIRAGTITRNVALW